MSTRTLPVASLNFELKDPDDPSSTSNGCAGECEHPATIAVSPAIKNVVLFIRSSPSQTVSSYSVKATDATHSAAAAQRTTWEMLSATPGETAEPARTQARLAR